MTSKPRLKTILLLTAEMERQAEEWGGYIEDYSKSHNLGQQCNTPAEWVCILSYALGKAAEAALPAYGGPDFKEQMIKIAAVALSAADHLDN